MSSTLMKEMPPVVMNRDVETRANRHVKDSPLTHLLNLVCTQKRANARLYRCAAATTRDPEAQRQYEDLRERYEKQVFILEDLLHRLGRPSPVQNLATLRDRALGARLLEAMFLSEFMDIESQESACLAAVLLAELKDHDHWQGLTRFVSRMPHARVTRLLRVAMTKVESLGQGRVSDAAASWRRALVGAPRRRTRLSTDSKNRTSGRLYRLRRRDRVSGRSITPDAG